MTPTPTPRVDAAIERWKNRPWAGSPTDRPLMLARELERELANIKAERDALRAEVEMAREAMSKANDMHLGRCASSEPFTKYDYRHHACEARDIIRRALARIGEATHP